MIMLPQNKRSCMALDGETLENRRGLEFPCL